MVNIILMPIEYYIVVVVVSIEILLVPTITTCYQ